MLPANLIEHLKSENELLQIQLEDLNQMIKIREEELFSLRKTAAHAVMLQSKLDLNLDEFYQMQEKINLEQLKAEGARKREMGLEKELLQSIEMETAFYNIRDELASTKAAFTDINNEVEQIASLNHRISDLTTKVAELESNLEIARLENGFLKEEVDAYRKKEAEDGKR